MVRPQRDNQATRRPRRSLLRMALGSAMLFVVSINCGTEQFDLEEIRGTLPDSVLDGEADEFGPGIAELDSVELVIEASPQFCCNPLTIDFRAFTARGGAPPGTVWEWDFGDGRKSRGASLTHTFNWPGVYAIMVTAQFPGGETVREERSLSLVTDETGPTQVTLSPSASASNEANAVTVDAGEDRTVAGGDLVTLTAFVDTSDAESIGYFWLQRDGTPVELLQATSRVAQFVAPDADRTEELRFEVRASLGELLGSDELTILVVPSFIGPMANRRPTVVNRTFTVQSGDTATLSIDASDPDGDEIEFVITTPPSHGSLLSRQHSSPNEMSVVYQPDIGFVGTDSFRFHAEDGEVASNTATVTIRVIPGEQGPRVATTYHFVPVNTTAALTITAEDESDEPIDFFMHSEPLHGTIQSIERITRNTCTITFLPDPGFRGPDRFTVVARNGGEESEPADVRVTVGKKPVPWLELNANPQGQAAALGYTSSSPGGGNWTVLEYCLAGMEQWAEVTDLAIVTTSRMRIENRDLYPILMQSRSPALRIIGGLKSSDYVPGVMPFHPSSYDFADADAWMRIAEDAAVIAADTGENIVVLENETATRTYHDGGIGIDYVRLEAALAPLAETGIEFWWYLPQVQYDTDEFPQRFAETTQFVAAVLRALPDSRFITLYTSFSQWQGHSLIEPYREAMSSLAGIDRMNELLYVTESGFIDERYYYRPEEALHHMDLTLPTENLNIIYPGGSDWLRVAEEFNNLLPAIGRTIPQN